MTRPRLEVVEVIRSCRDAFLERYGAGLTPGQRRALDELTACRTAARVADVTGTRPSSSNQPTAASPGGGDSGTGWPFGSPRSGPAVTPRSTDRSSIVRAIGPTTPVSAKTPADVG